MSEQHDPTASGDLPGDPGEAPTVTGVLTGYAAAGYDTEMSITGAAKVRCGACGQEIEPEDMGLDSVRRLEGASDPDDMQAVVALTCVCGAKGALVVAYGPHASEEEADVFAALPDHREESDIPSSRPPVDEAAIDG